MGFLWNVLIFFDQKPLLLFIIVKDHLAIYEL